MTMNQNFDFNAIIQPAHQTARAKGFWDDCRKWLPAPEGANLYGHIDAAILLDELDHDKVQAVLLQKILLIMTEVGEAYDEVRKGGDLSALRYDGYGVSVDLFGEQPRMRVCAETLREGTSFSQAEVNRQDEPVPGACTACGKPHKPIGYASELADILIRIADLYGAVGWLWSKPDYVWYTGTKRDNLFGAMVRALGQAATECGEVRRPRMVCCTLDEIVGYVIALAVLDNIDLTAVVQAKMAYNKTRPRLHGKLF